MRYLFFAGCLLLALCAQAGLVIMKDGQPRAVIVIAEKPSTTARHAAEELQTFIKLMSGTSLAIRSDALPLPTGQIVLLVGKSKYTAEMNIPVGEDLMRSREGFVLRTLADRIVLAGNEDGQYHGTEYAVYELLERLGCRWYYPGDYGQVVPKKWTIEVPTLDLTQTPSFIVRNVWTSGWAAGTDDYNLWLLRNKGNANDQYASAGDGTLANLAPPAKYAKEHPEIYALGKDGTRPDHKADPSWTMLCTSNPLTVKIAAETIKQYFRDNPNANSYAFSPPDNNAVCYCPDCQARMHDFQSYAGYESISDPFFNFANNVAWEVCRDFPDKRLLVMSYYSRVTPPEGLEKPWHPNIIIQLAQLWGSAARPIDSSGDISARRQLKTLEAWSRLAPTKMIYDYDPHADLSRMPYWRPRAIARDLRVYKRHGVIGFTTEGQPTYFRTGLNYYIRARLMWDVNADVDKLLDDYYVHFFGPAAVPMKKFHEEIEGMLQASPDHISWRGGFLDYTTTYPPARVAALGTLLDQAEARANTPAIKQHLRMYRLLHTYMTAYLRIFTLQHEARYAEALRLSDTLKQVVDEAEALQRGLLPPDPQWVFERPAGFGSLLTHLTMHAERTDGVHGQLLGLAPVYAQFRTDLDDLGIVEKWQNDAVAADLPWARIDLRKDWGLNGFRDELRYPYAGYGWYRMTFPVRAPAAGRAQLVLPSATADKLWIWVNGQLAYSPTTVHVEPGTPIPPDGATRIIRVGISRSGFNSLTVDVQDRLRMNADNTIVIRILHTHPAYLQRGLMERPYVWAPVK